MKSHSVNIKPTDSRCRHWAKIVRSGEALPLPVDAQSANDIPAPYSNAGEEELLPGDFLFEGEANHHTRTDRGWKYKIRTVTDNGELISLRSGFAAQKAELKAQGMAFEMLTGAGDIAAMIRIAHGLRAGLKVTPPSVD